VHARHWYPLTPLLIFCKEVNPSAHVRHPSPLIHVAHEDKHGWHAFDVGFK
jgi:hypothetical protein